MALLELSDEEKKMIRSGRSLPEIRPAQTGLSPRELDIAGMNDRARQLRESEERRRDEWHRSNMKARERRLESSLAAGADGGRYSPITMDRMRNELEYIRGGGITGLRQHELDVADKNIEQERVKAWGMANQGGVAAGIRAGVDRELGRAQHGYFDENGNYVPGSTVRAAEATGLWKSELQDNNWRNRMDQIRLQEEGRNNRQQQQIEAGKEKTDAWREEKGLDREANKNNADARNKAIQERLAQQDAMREQRDFEAFDMKARGGIFNNPLKPEEKKEYLELKTIEERKAWWKSHFGRVDQQQDGAPAAGGKPKEGDRRETANGMAVFRNGKWVLETK